MTDLFRDKLFCKSVFLLKKFFSEMTSLGMALTLNEVSGPA